MADKRRLKSSYGEHIKPVLSILNGKLGFYPKNYNIKETPEQKLIRINRHYNQNNY